jgi:hypothetical protein
MKNSVLLRRELSNTRSRLAKQSEWLAMNRSARYDSKGGASPTLLLKSVWESEPCATGSRVQASPIPVLEGLVLVSLIPTQPI